METEFMLAHIFTGINLVLALALLVMYARIFVKARSSFTGGLLLFASLFVIQNAVSFYFFTTMMPFFVPEVATYVMVLAFIQTGALALLNWITWK
jgi:hypothetical protein